MNDEEELRNLEGMKILKFLGGWLVAQKNHGVLP
jgi:hypothetical protein